MSGKFNDSWEKSLNGNGNSELAKNDCDGASNTKQTLEVQPSDYYVAGSVASYSFPDGATKGYVPSLGEFNLAYKNKEAIDEALARCGGNSMSLGFHWSSTFYGRDGSRRYCWIFAWDDGSVGLGLLDVNYAVRPFAPLN